MDKDKVILAFCTAPSNEADLLAKRLVEEGLAACVNICPVVSHYRWQGAVCRENEALLIIKTVQQMMESLSKRIIELHSYQVPEIVFISPDSGFPPYMEWVRTSVGTG